MLFNSISLLKLFRCWLYAQEGLQQTCVSLKVCYCAEFCFMIENHAMGIFIMKYIFSGTYAGDFYSSGFRLLLLQDPDFTHVYNYEQKSLLWTA